MTVTPETLTDEMVRALPSVKQCLSRMGPIHARILRGEKLWGGASLSDGRGWNTAKATLRRWGAVDGNAITDRGREILTAWDARQRDAINAAARSKP